MPDTWAVLVSRRASLVTLLTLCCKIGTVRSFAEASMRGHASVRAACKAEPRAWLGSTLQAPHRSPNDAVPLSPLQNGLDPIPWIPKVRLWVRVFTNAWRGAHTRRRRSVLLVVVRQRACRLGPGPRQLALPLTGPSSLANGSGASSGQANASPSMRRAT